MDFDYDEILNHTDLVLLDLKHIHKTDYEKMTGRSMDRFEEFLNALKNIRLRYGFAMSLFQELLTAKIIWLS